MKLGGGVQNNANTPAINSQRLTANLPPPGFPNRWVLDQQAKILYLDTGTALIPIITNLTGTGFVPYTGAAHDVDLVSTKKGLYAEFAEIGYGAGDGAGVYGVLIYNQDPAANGGLLVQAGNATVPAISVQDLTGSSADYILLYGDGHAVFLSYVQASEFKIINAGGKIASIKNTGLINDFNFTLPKQAGTLMVNPTVFQGLSQQIIGSTGSTDIKTFNFQATPYTTNGINLLCFYNAVNVTAVTVAPSWNIVVAFVDSTGTAVSFQITSRVGTPVSNVAIGPGLYMAKTGTVTVTLSFTAGSCTYDWMLNTTVIANSI